MCSVTRCMQQLAAARRSTSGSIASLLCVCVCVCKRWPLIRKAPGTYNFMVDESKEIKQDSPKKIFTGSSKCCRCSDDSPVISIGESADQTCMHACSGQDLIAEAGMPGASTSPTQLPAAFAGTRCAGGNVAADKTGADTATGTGSGGAGLRVAAGLLQAGAAGGRPRMALPSTGTRGTMGRLSQVHTSTMKPSGSWKKSWSTKTPPSSTRRCT